MITDYVSSSTKTVDEAHKRRVKLAQLFRFVMLYDREISECLTKLDQNYAECEPNRTNLASHSGRLALIFAGIDVDAHKTKYNNYIKREFRINDIPSDNISLLDDKAVIEEISKLPIDIQIRFISIATALIDSIGNKHQIVVYSTNTFQRGIDNEQVINDYLAQHHDHKTFVDVVTYLLTKAIVNNKDMSLARIAEEIKKLIQETNKMYRQRCREYRRHQYPVSNTFMENRDQDAFGSNAIITYKIDH